jgi:hypothetical protein
MSVVLIPPGVFTHKDAHLSSFHHRWETWTLSPENWRKAWRRVDRPSASYALKEQKIPSGQQKTESNSKERTLFLVEEILGKEELFTSFLLDARW